MNQKLFSNRTFSYDFSDGISVTMKGFTQEGIDVIYLCTTERSFLHKCLLAVRSRVLTDGTHSSSD